MKTFITFLSTLCILGIVFYGLSVISKQNEFTSVRHYLLKTQETVSNTGSIDSTNSGTVAEVSNTGTLTVDTTPPIIEISNYKSGDVVTTAEVTIELQYSDNITATKDIKTTGGGVRTLEMGFNPIVVSATDEAGNIGTTYIIIERK